MKKYEIVSLGGNEDEGCVFERWSFDSVRELDERDRWVMSGVVMMCNCSGMSDGDVEKLKGLGMLYGSVKELLDEVVEEEESMWLGVEDDEDREVWDRFVEKYGEMRGIRWGIEYDDNVSVLLNGSWDELREEVKVLIEEDEL